MKSGDDCIRCGHKFYWFDPCCENPQSKTERDQLEEASNEYFAKMPKFPTHRVASYCDVNEARRLGFIDGLKAAKLQEKQS